MKRKPKVVQPRILEIEWTDACGLMNVWEQRDGLETLPPSSICSIGYLWETTKNYITICQSYSPMQVARRFSIPRGCIKKVKVIRK